MSIAIIGTVGVPARYGGFETLADNLVRYHAAVKGDESLAVYCSSRAYPDRPPRYHNADLYYVPLNANGLQSILYDLWALLAAIRRGSDTILLLGVSGALGLPIVRVFSKARIVCNIDGIEWRREKWGWLASALLRTLEWAAVSFSDIVVSDNDAIADYVRATYGKTSIVIPYGGDHAVVQVPGHGGFLESLPKSFALAICRIEPENNVHLILEAYNSLREPLVFVGNWNNSEYGRQLRSKYCANTRMRLLDPVYGAGELYEIRSRASVYVHGHSAGGTNPSLVEMMHFAVPILAFDCVFNRCSTEGRAMYFTTAAQLAEIAPTLQGENSAAMGACMLEIAQRRYTWNKVGRAYWQLFGSCETE